MDFREARFKSNQTQWDVSIKTGIPQSRISLMERGYVHPTADEAAKICAALDITKDSIQWPPLPPDFRPNTDGLGAYWFQGTDAEESFFLDAAPWRIAGTRIHLKYGSTEAFAKDAGMTPDDVYAVLQRRRGLTFGEADRWAKLLDLPMKYTRHFFVRVEKPEPIRPKPEPPTDRTALGEIVGMGSVEDAGE